MKIAVFASHEGTTLQAIADACEAGTIAGRVVAVISNNSGSRALQRARATGIPASHLSARVHPDPDELDTNICRVLVNREVDVVVLAGYMKKIAGKTLAQFRGRILNTHPALLPKFGGRGMYGLKVHQAVLAAGEPKTGATVHMVTEDYDMGPVVAQCEVRVEPNDTPETLASRVQEQERSLLIHTLSLIADGGLRIPLEKSDP